MVVARVGGVKGVRSSTDADRTALARGEDPDVLFARSEGQGVGRALMDAAETWSRSRGHRFVTLSVFPNDTRALRMSIAC